MIHDKITYSTQDSMGVVWYIFSMTVYLPIRAYLSALNILYQVYHRMRHGIESVGSRIDIPDDAIPVVYVGGFAAYGQDDVVLSTVFPSQLHGAFVPRVGPLNAVRHRIPLLIRQLQLRYPGWGDDGGTTRLDFVGTSFGVTTILGMLAAHPHLGAGINRIAFVSPVMGGFLSRYHDTPPRLNSV